MEPLSIEGERVSDAEAQLLAPSPKSHSILKTVVGVLLVVVGLLCILSGTLAFLYLKKADTPLLQASTKKGMDGYVCQVPGAESFKPARGICAQARQRLIEQFTTRGISNYVVYFEGGHTQNQYYSDTELYFRQESNFLYMSGYQVAEALFVLLSNTSAGYGILFVKRPTTNDAVWNGIPKTIDQLKAEYDVDNIYYTDQFQSVLQSWPATTVYTLPGVQFTTTQTRAVFGRYTQNNNTVQGYLGAIRSIKSNYEMDVLRLASDVSNDAHISVMQETAKNNLRYEYQAAGRFHEVSEACGGWNHQSYLSIVGAGPRSSVLHYNTNYEPIQPGDMVLVDAGAEFFGWGTDITRTWPMNGKFTVKQGVCYNIVLACQNAALTFYKAGQRYSDASSIVIDVLLQGLLDANLVRGTIAQLRANQINQLFLPHGLGHHVGLDVHDPGSLSVFANGMLVTVEPGLYFIPELLNPAFQNPTKAQYLNIPLIQEYMNEPGIGGFRIEDVVFINSLNPDGQEILSIKVPRTIRDIEALMAGAAASRRRR